MKNAKDYIQDNGPGKHTITSLAYWLTPEGLSNPITAAMLRDAIETSPDKEFIEAFDGATKDEARDFLAAYELCAMPYWGADELAKAIHDADNGRDEKQALRAVTLAQNVKELPDTFTPKRGIEWAMDRGYLFGIHARFAGAAIGTYGHPHNPLKSHLKPEAATVVTKGASVVTHSTKPPRRDLITPVIEVAQSKCKNPQDTAEVWAQMELLADSENAPLLAATETGLKYRREGKDAYFTRDALDKRLHPEKRGRPAERR
jgi:hypothetical protein